MPSSNLGRLRELQAVLDRTVPKNRRNGFRTGLNTWDALLPGHIWPRSAIHELLYPQADDSCSPVAGLPVAPAAILASRASQTGLVAWIDPSRHIYPPALLAFDIPLDRVLWICPKKPQDLTWTIAECLRCPGVDVTIASPPSLSRIEVRRLQLAAETGGGIGLLLRRHNPASAYAAATRWLVRPVPATRDGRKWILQLLHGHGGLVGQSILLELDHETHSLRVSAPVADRSIETTRRYA